MLPAARGGEAQAVKKKASNKKKTQVRKRNGTRSRLTPRKDKRGLQA